MLPAHHLDYPAPLIGLRFSGIVVREPGSGGRPGTALPVAYQLAGHRGHERSGRRETRLDRVFSSSFAAPQQPAQMPASPSRERLTAISRPGTMLAISVAHCHRAFARSTRNSAGCHCGMGGRLAWTSGGRIGGNRAMRFGFRPVACAGSGESPRRPQFGITHTVVNQWRLRGKSWIV